MITFLVLVFVFLYLVGGLSKLLSLPYVLARKLQNKARRNWRGDE